MNTLLGAAAVFLTSLSALPISYILNTVAQTKNQLYIALVGGGTLLVISLVPWLILRNKIQKMDSFFYVLGMLTFRSVQGLTIALENDSFIADFMAHYLKEAIPYLKTSYGTMACYWDGIVHYSLYLMMLAAMSWNQSFYDVGLYWSGSYGYMLLITILGVFMGKDGVTFISFLHIPFIVVWLWGLLRFIDEKRQERRDIKAELSKQNIDLPTSIWKRPIDLCFVIYFSCTTILTTFKFIVAFEGDKSDLVHWYATKVEPYLTDLLPYAKAQCMVNLLYFVPYYCLNIYALIRPGHQWMYVWSTVFAGVAGMSQVSFMGASFHYRTPYIHRVPQTTFAVIYFWVVNGTMLVVPHLLAFRCQSNPYFFLKDTRKKNLDDPSTSPNANTLSGRNQRKTD